MSVQFGYSRSLSFRIRWLTASILANAMWWGLKVVFPSSIAGRRGDARSFRAVISEEPNSRKTLTNSVLTLAGILRGGGGGCECCPKLMIAILFVEGLPSVKIGTTK